MTDEIKCYALFVPVLGDTAAEQQEFVDRVTAKLKAMKGFVGCHVSDIQPAFYALFEDFEQVRGARMELYNDCPFAQVMKKIAYVDRREIRPWEK